ncbi:ferredoxin [Mycobacterium sp. ENV421]|uniref:ferredoxin n=1 Tax=Mycobacterium sp. ENV421 TaxID=1213407 RepID=UPI001E367D8B|nr:ferredoxin [Mycobacterium sp. ENV421]
MTSKSAEVTVDLNGCMGHARCHSLAPAVYDLDDEGKSVVIVNPVPAELVNEAEEGAQACPEHAITIRYHD